MFKIGEVVKIISMEEAISKYSVIMRSMPQRAMFPSWMCSQYCRLWAMIKGYTHGGIDSELSYIVFIPVTSPDLQITTKHVYPEWMLRSCETKINWEEERQRITAENNKKIHEDCQRTMKKMAQVFQVPIKFLYGEDHESGDVMRLAAEYKDRLRITKLKGDLPQSDLTMGKLGIKDVIFNKKSTVIIWEDDTKTMVRASGSDEVNPVTGFLHAFFKHATKNYSNKKRSEFFERLTDIANKQLKTG